LTELKDLQEKLEKYRLTHKQLDLFIERNLKLDELGFMPNAAFVLATELSKRGLKVQEAAGSLSEMLSTHGNLEEGISDLRENLSDVKSQVQELEKKVVLKKSEIEDLEEERKKQEKSIKELEKKLSHNLFKISIDLFTCLN
jgi:hypothetical protein